MRMETNKLRIKVLVACHKEDLAIREDDVYMPIQVGKALYPELDFGFQCDNEGDNISDKNGSYCELTAIYWAWKNLKDVNVIGLCHYRRYFDFYNQCNWPYAVKAFPVSHLPHLDFSIPESIAQQVRSGAVVASKPIHHPYSLGVDYCVHHYSEDMETIKAILHENHKEYEEAYAKVIESNNLMRPFNMFLMNWADFEHYCDWIFAILKEAENRIRIEYYNPVQHRIWGYIAERLLNVWLYAEQKKVIGKPVIWLDDEMAKSQSPLRIAVSALRNDLTMNLLRIR